MFKIRLLMTLSAVTAVAGRAPEVAGNAAAPAAEAGTTADTPAQASADKATFGLAGTAWRLLNIAGMDDSNDYPDVPSKYTLEFGADGTASLRADCNRGTGTWKSESPSQLTFGPIAATRAMCPPGSLSDKYLAQFEWVRSYVMKDGHLFLATMAYGAIIEFEPLPPVVAIVFGEEIRAGEAGEMGQEKGSDPFSRPLFPTPFPGHARYGPTIAKRSRSAERVARAGVGGRLHRGDACLRGRERGCEGLRHADRAPVLRRRPQRLSRYPPGE